MTQFKNHGGDQYPDFSDDADFEIDPDFEDDGDDYPHLYIYAGANGTFDMHSNGKKVSVPIEGCRYDLPLDTDIIQINANSVCLQGDVTAVKSIGKAVINAQELEINFCPQLHELPPMHFVNCLELSYCPRLEFFHPDTHVSEVNLCKTGIRMLPAGLKNSLILIEDCNRLEFIHPEIPEKGILGLEPKKIQRCKMQYLFEFANEAEFQAYFHRENKIWKEKYAHIRT